uniref:Sulfhydryl oxidase n=1 Tax=Parascaris univalens TaxID=6257 RepID=A0A914ZRY6_PARUN
LFQEMQHRRQCLFVLFVWIISECSSLIANKNYKPAGTSPLLYRPGVDPIIQLDYNTFEDTIFGQNHAFVVEFYADWCGHCRAFAPHFREFAAGAHSWHSIVSVAAVNCADPLNQNLCMQQNIFGYPLIKYYPRNARHAGDAITLDLPEHSAASLRTLVARAVLNEYNKFHYSDWPQLSHLLVSGKSTYGDLWIGVQPSANYLAILFEQFDSVGGPFLLDLWPSRNDVGARRALASSPLVSMLRIRRFPLVALFVRNQQQAVYMKPFTAQSVEEVRLLVSSPFPSTETTTTPHPVITTSQIPIINCNIYPRRCQAMYFVSETDMLKAMRIALLDEVVKTSNRISNENFTALFNFVDLLAEHFPVYTFSNGLPKEHRRSRRAPLMLKTSSKARHIFVHMREFLRAHKREMSVSSADWHHQFINVERIYGRPFPQNASWEHCKGSTPQLRGYTCGLWTTFHALTINVYLEAKDEEQDPLKPLKAIKGWVSSFFGCLHCRRHFHHMTAKLFPMNERRIRQASDAIMYLWRAHNIVNLRLHTDLTEDPQFEKRQFPAPFLCPTCQVGNEHFSRKEVRSFLLRYYGNIRAHISEEEQAVSATL